MKTLTAVIAKGYCYKLCAVKKEIHAYLKFLFLHILELPYQRIELDYKNELNENIDQKEWDLPVYYHK